MEPVRFQVVEEDGVSKVLEIYKVVVHKFSVSDVEDPDLYAAEPIMKWQKSESGKYVMQHAIETPVFHKQLDYASYGYQYAITAELEKRKYSEFLLKYGRYGNYKS